MAHTFIRNGTGGDDVKSVRLLVFGVVSIALSFLLGTARGIFGFASMVEPTSWSYVVFAIQILMLALGLALILWWAVVRLRARSDVPSDPGASA